MPLSKSVKRSPSSDVSPKMSTSSPLSPETTAPPHGPDGDGRRMVQGLLTASLLTSIGGDLEVLASRMDLQFQRPVYTGETLVCELTVVSADPHTVGGVALVGDVAVRRSIATITLVRLTQPLRTRQIVLPSEPSCLKRPSKDYSGRICSPSSS